MFSLTFHEKKDKKEQESFIELVPDLVDRIRRGSSSRHILRCIYLHKITEPNSRKPFAARALDQPTCSFC